jgi:phospholipase/carboxylesterase
MSRRVPKKNRRVARGHGSAAGGVAAPERLPAVSTWLGEDRFFTPLGYEPGYDYPLLVWLAGGSAPDRTDGFDLGRVMKRVSLRNFVAVQPVVSPVDRSGASCRPTGALFSGSSLEDAVWRSIDRVCERIAIHPGRIFLVGQGAGGADAFRIGCRHPRDFAGIVSLGGPFPHGEALFAQLADVRRLPMLYCCQRSTAAAQAEHTDRTLRLFHAAGAALAMRIYPANDDLSRLALADVNRWLMDEVCGTQAVVHTLSTP